MLGWIVLITLFAGVFGTGIGGIIGALFKRDSTKLVSLLLSFAGGVMLSIVCFDLISEAILLDGVANGKNLIIVIGGVLVGYGIIFLLNNLIDSKTNCEIAHIDKNHPKVHDGLDELIHSNHLDAHKKRNSSMFMAGLIMAIAIALHNLPEGMVIGASYVGETEGKIIGSGAFALALVIGLHNIPEGMAVSVPLINSGMNKITAILITASTGIPTILGAMLGYALGAINPLMQSIMLSLASGAMLYVVFGELLPQSILMWKSKLPSFAVLVGILLGIIIIFA